MKTVRIAVALIALIALTVGAGGTVVAKDHKVTVCHNIQLTGDTANNVFNDPIAEGTTIEVSQAAYENHVAHGDHEGPCDPNPAGTLVDLDGDGTDETYVVLVERPYDGNPDIF